MSEGFVAMDDCGAVAADVPVVHDTPENNNEPYTSQNQSINRTLD